MFALCLLCRCATAAPLDREQSAWPDDLAASYAFLVTPRRRGGVLYRASAGDLNGRLLPLSFVDSAAYWAQHVCGGRRATCAVTDRYDPAAYTLLPEPGPAGELQTERVDTHAGTNLYDAATWQIAVMLGAVRNGFSVPGGDSWALVSNQNRLLAGGHFGAADPPAPAQIRALTRGDVFVYNGTRVTDPARAYVFRTLPRRWLAHDPLAGSRHADWITTQGLPPQNPRYRRGAVSWTDWKPVSGENAWAFLIGPLQAAYLHYVVDRHQSCVPLQAPAVQAALAMLPTFAAMQSQRGGVYYAPRGTVANRGDALVDPHAVAVENSISLYAGLRILQHTLRQAQTCGGQLSATERASVTRARSAIRTLIDGGVNGHQRTAGLLAFFRRDAWRDGAFVQGGLADAPDRPRWVTGGGPRAVDVNTWGIAALGTRRLDTWFGFGAAYRAWQQVKGWGGYGVGTTLWGVGYSDVDGNGHGPRGDYRQGVLSAEWTAGAVLAVRDMIHTYAAVPAAASQHAAAAGYLATLRADEASMLAGIARLRSDRYPAAGFPGQPRDYAALINPPTRPYLYASRRYPIPFGWYANPLPSTCATAWVVMLADHFNPFVYGGGTGDFRKIAIRTAPQQK